MSDQPRTPSNTYFQKQNHLRLKKSEVTKSNILSAGVQRASGIGITISDPFNAAFSVFLTGLTNNEAVIGTHAAIGYTTDPVSATDTNVWSYSADPRDGELGTGAAPPDFIAGDGGRLYLHVTDTVEGEVSTVSVSALIRYARGTAPVIADGQSFTVGTAITAIDGSASGANLTFTYALSGAPAGLMINASTGLVTGAPTEAATGSAAVTATDQYGLDYTDTFTWDSTALPVGTAPNVADGQVFVVFEDANIDGSASGDGLTFTYTLTGVVGTVAINSSTGLITGQVFSLGVGGTATITATDQHGREFTDTFTWTREAAPVISGVPTISGTLQEGEVLTATAASVTGLPASTQSWQWNRSGVVITGGDNATYTIVSDDVGETLTVVQAETNIHGAATAESAATAVITSTGGVGEWLPTDLFEGAASGTYVDFGTRFASMTDLTVAAPGDAVGFALDVGNGAGYADGAFTGLGPELVTNGDGGTFATGVAGVVAQDATALRETTVFPDGGLAITANGGAVPLAAIQTFATTPGKTYRLSAKGYAPSSNVRPNAAVIGIEALGFFDQVTAENEIQDLSISFVAVSSSHTARGQVLDPGVAWGVNGDKAIFDDVSGREIPGSHAFQNTLSQQPTAGTVPITGRRNLLTHTDDLANAIWTKEGLTVDDNSGARYADPLDGTRAIRLVENGDSTRHRVYYSGTVAGDTDGPWNETLYIKYDNRRYVDLELNSGGNANATGSVTLDLVSGSVATPIADPQTAGLTADLSADLGNGWRRLKLSATTLDSAGTGTPQLLFHLMDDTKNRTYTSGGAAVFVFAPQLEVGIESTPYQKVVSEYEVSEAGVESVEYVHTDPVNSEHFHLSNPFSVGETFSIGMVVDATYSGSGHECLVGRDDGVNSVLLSADATSDQIEPQNGGVLRVDGVRMWNPTRADVAAALGTKRHISVDERTVQAAEASEITFGARADAALPIQADWFSTYLTDETDTDLLADHADVMTAHGITNKADYTTTQAVEGINAGVFDSSTTRMFTTSDGTDNVTAGSDVGRIISVNGGAYREYTGTGPELVTDGAFAALTHWTGNDAEAGLSLEAGRLRVTNDDGTAAFAYQDLSGTVSVGDRLRITADGYDGTSAANLRVGRTAGGTDYLDVLLSEGGSFEFAVSSNTDLFVALRNESTTSGHYSEFDNVSLKELTDPVWTGLGDERVADPSFDSGTGWVGAEWTISNGQASIPGTSGFLQATNTAEIGATYLVSVDVAANSGGLRFYPGNATYFQFPIGAGTYEFVWKATATSLQFWDGGANVTLNSVSLREIPGIQIDQPTLANRPTYDAATGLIVHTDGVYKRLKVATTYFTAEERSSMSLVMLAKDVGSVGAIFGSTTTTDAALYWQNSSGNSTLSVNAGTPSYILNAAPATWADRDAAHAAFASGTHLIEIHGADLSASQFDEIYVVSAGGGSTWLTTGKFMPLYIGPTLGTMERNILRNCGLEEYAAIGLSYT